MYLSLVKEFNEYRLRTQASVQKTVQAYTRKIFYRNLLQLFAISIIGNFLLYFKLSYLPAYEGPGYYLIQTQK